MIDSKQKQTKTQIACDVQNCTYHGEDNRCTAGKIKVGPQHAVSSTDTVCATFKPEHNSTF